ncbi:MAG: twin-arginine translocase TatA/TatE family subunit [Candidatus Sericytochromatia bacterium]|nr:twin-arginine translocase TatA/TatE family subunit [Candidatus Sericytochromatia bacterium]
MFGIGAPELVLILIIALVIFGPSKLPQIGASLGKGIRDFKAAMQEIENPPVPVVTPRLAATQPTSAPTQAAPTPQV